MRLRKTFSYALACATLSLGAAALVAQSLGYLTWTAAQAEEAATNMTAKGRVSGTRGFMNTRTDQSRSYKLRALWLTPDVIRGAARVLQLRDALNDEQTRKLVAEAEAVADTVVMIELDPEEGSGVIPSDWSAILKPKGADEGKGAPGTDSPQLRDIRALNGVTRRDYAYEVFGVVFPLKTDDGSPLFAPDDKEAELSVRIHDKVGRVRWTVPESARQKP